MRVKTSFVIALFHKKTESKVSIIYLLSMEEY